MSRAAVDARRLLLHLGTARSGLRRARGCRRQELRPVRRRQDRRPAAERTRQRDRAVPHRHRRHGPLKADAKPQAASRLPGLDKAYMPEPVTGGAAPEDEDSARTAAPGRMQSLARAGQSRRHRGGGAGHAGVLRAGATWDLSTGFPRVAGHHSHALAQRRRRRRGRRCAARAQPGARAGALSAERVRAGAGNSASPPRSATTGPIAPQDMTAGILEALGAGAADGSEPANGLFGWQQRQFGEGAHGSQIVAAIQKVPGVALGRAHGGQRQGLGTFCCAPTALPRAFRVVARAARHRLRGRQHARARRGRPRAEPHAGADERGVT